MTTEAGCGREPLVETIVRFLARERVTDAREIRECVERAIDESGPDAIDSLSARLVGAGADWAYYPHDPLARRIHHALASRVLQPEPVVRGTHHLDRVRGTPLVIFANHLSYSDANVVEVILRSAGASCLADRLTAIAGPKVYSNVTRRFSSLCFGTIKVPQSSERSSEDAVMNPRDVARAARRAIQIAAGTPHARRSAVDFCGGQPESNGTDAAISVWHGAISRTARHMGAADRHCGHRETVSHRRRRAASRADYDEYRPADAGVGSARSNFAGIAG